MSSEDAAVGAAERLHPLFLVTGLGRGLRQMFGAYAALGYLAATGSWRVALLGVAGVAALLVFGTFFYWRRFEYRVGAHEIRIDSGIVNRTHRSIAFDRIQDVDISQGPIARLLGLARVKFETGGSAGDEDGTLAAIALPRAEALRAQVRQRRALAAEVVAGAADAAEPAPLFAMDLRRLLLAGTFNFSLAVLAGLFGLSQTIGDVAGVAVFSRRFWRDVLDAGSPLADLILAHQLFALVAGTIVLLALGLGTGVVRTMLRDYRFRLDSTATGLRRRRGLLTLTDVTVPLRRVQAAIVGSGPLRDRFGWSELRLQSLAQDEASKGDHVVAPLARDGEVAAILAELGWRAVDPAAAWSRSSPVVARAWTVALSLLLLPLAVAAAFNQWIGAGGAAAVALLAALRWLRWRRFGFRLEDDRLLIRSGWWRRRLVILPLGSVQSVELIENLFSRRLGLATLWFGVASGRGYSLHMIPGLSREVAHRLRGEVLAPYAAG